MLLLGGAILTVVSIAEARPDEIAACKWECRWESRFHRCVKRCLEDAPLPLPGTGKPYADPHARPVELWLRFPSDLIGGGLAGVSLIGLLALILRIIDRLTRH